MFESRLLRAFFSRFRNCRWFSSSPMFSYSLETSRTVSKSMRVIFSRRASHKAISTSSSSASCWKMVESVVGPEELASTHFGSRSGGNRRCIGAVVLAYLLSKKSVIAVGCGSSRQSVGTVATMIWSLKSELADMVTTDQGQRQSNGRGRLSLEPAAGISSLCDERSPFPGLTTPEILRKEMPETHCHGCYTTGMIVLMARLVFTC